MKSFHTIAVPHPDILEGRLTMDIFAAKLWDVYLNRGADEYKDPNQFFSKTYLTEGLQNLITIVQNRLSGKGGDPVIQIQTPFGGGKTHALIALYHKNADVNRVVMDGVFMSGSETLWGVLEQQLAGKIDKCAGLVSPGGDIIYRLIEQYKPVLIMMDEVLEYVTKAAGVKVGDTTLAEQTLAFLQELTTVASGLPQVSLLMTLPSSDLEHYSAESERFLAQVAHVVGRMEKIYTPVQESEITRIVRQRLFSSVDTGNVANVVQAFMGYAERESILPPDTEPSEYRKRFESSYPFMPEVVDTLYHRWGSFPNFQRTRGVLRLLALVIHSMRNKEAAYISLSDFNLAEAELFRELLKHIGQEFDSVAAADITGSNANSKRVDQALGDAYKGLRLGSRSATTMFMYSFSGKDEIGATLGEIKRSATTLSNPSSVVAEALEKIKDTLFYTQYDGGKYFFSNQPNINRILLTRMENVAAKDVFDLENDLLRKALSGKKLKTLLIPVSARPDVQDDASMKLVVLMDRDDNVIREIYEKRGNTPRVHRNTLFFLAPMESEKIGFHNNIRRTLAYRHIINDQKLKLTDDQRKQLKSELKKDEENLNDSLRRYYRWLISPGREGLKEADLGIPTFGDTRPIDDAVYDKLRAQNEILENLAPLVIKEKFLNGPDGFVYTEQLHSSSLKTPGEPRPISADVWVRSISDGVKKGLFGLGELEDGKFKCHYFKEDPQVGLTGGELLIKAEICERVRLEAAKNIARSAEVPAPFVDSPGGTGPHTPSGDRTTGETMSLPLGHKEINLRFKLPKGKASNLLGIINLLQHNFQSTEITIRTKDGQITEDDYDAKILEAFRQAGIEVE
ncbi:MAG: DUF499 domain-containing protein [Desulfomonilaceae bacterium]